MTRTSKTKIGIAIPCYVDDKHLLPICLHAIKELEPRAHTYLVDLNRGEGGLKAIRTRLFDRLFATCDIVLNCDIEFYLFPDILSHVRDEKTTSFSFLLGQFSDIIKVVARFLSRRPWTGCYSIPKSDWKIVRDSSLWDGTDTSIQKIVKTYVFVHTPKYYLLRRSPRRIKAALAQKSLLGKIRYLLVRGV